ncbi:MAG: nitrate- and nitrite sensing domain-containing protein [Campylobacterota bacterium]|nr:nitrate- and nitrite sensing domain-containing protein [Campylobacterota bacterium]
MFKNNKIKLKLLVPLSILSVIFLFLTSSIIYHHYKKTTSLSNLNNEIILATKLSEVLHEIQRERGISVVYIRSNGTTFQMQYELQREITDDSINTLKIFLENSYKKHNYQNIEISLNKLLNRLLKLNNVRESIIKNKQFDIKNTKKYTEINSEILNTIIEISKVSQLPKITQNIISYTHFLYFKEYAGIERAIGVSIISNKNNTKEKLIKFNSNFEKQKHSKKFFEKYISKEIKPIYRKILKHKSFQIVKKTRKMILETEEIQTINISIFSWFENTTNRIDQLHIVGEYLYEEVISNIQEELDSSYSYFILFGFLNILILILFIFLVVFIYKMIEEDQKQKAMQQKIKLAQMGEIISMIAHQWRQPLAAISSTSSGINLKAKLNKLDKDTAIELSSKISQYSQHLSTTIDDFRDFFKPNKEKKEIKYDDVIIDVLNIIEDSIVTKDIKIIKKLNCNDTLYTYTNEIKQVVLNIIKNAEDILVEKNIVDPTITIETSCGELKISDNGGGIPEDIIDKIFDPYFSTKLEKDGTGLGLYMSKIIIEEHCGGELTVSNDKVINQDGKPSCGAVFKIELDNNKTNN